MNPLQVKCYDSCLKSAIKYREEQLLLHIPRGENLNNPSVKLEPSTKNTLPRYVSEISQSTREVCGEGLWWDGTPIKVHIFDTGVDATHINQGMFSLSDHQVLDWVGEGLWDGNGHGTHVGGSIVGDDPRNSFKGMCPKAKATFHKVLDRRGSGGVTEIAAAYRYSREVEADFNNASLGGGFSQVIEDELLENHSQTQMVQVAAIGNEGTRGDGHPGNSMFSLGSGAIDFDNLIAPFSSRSQRGYSVDRGVNTLSGWLNGRYARISGSSMSSPIFCAKLMLAAGYLSKILEAKPTRAQLLDFVKQYFIDLGPSGYDVSYFNGHLDLDNMVEDNPLTDPVDPDPIDPEEDPDCILYLKTLSELKAVETDLIEALKINRERQSTVMSDIDNFLEEV